MATCAPSLSGPGPGIVTVYEPAGRHASVLEVGTTPEDQSEAVYQLSVVPFQVSAPPEQVGAALASGTLKGIGYAGRDYQSCCQNGDDRERYVHAAKCSP